MSIDYGKLLKKYIDYIHDVEGTAYIEIDNRYRADVVFTKDEWNELKRINRELWGRGG